jgi:hypothetical protein
MMEGRAGGEPKISAETRYVAPGYFDVMRIPWPASRAGKDRIPRLSVPS